MITNSGQAYKASTIVNYDSTVITYSSSEIPLMHLGRDRMFNDQACLPLLTVLMAPQL